ncbi:MAG: hypothetical protein R2852_01960 [Bacteroidia bacterium]
MKTEIKRVIGILSIAMATCFTLDAQYSSDHYHPKEIIRSERIDSCLIYKYEDDSASVFEKYVYDSLGNEIEVIHYENKSRNVMHYNDSNLLVSDYLIPFNEQYFQKDTFIYNAKNQLISNKTFENTGRVSYEKTVYYIDSNIATVEVKFGESSLIYDYAYMNNMLYWIYKKFNGVEDGREELSYDENGNLKSYKVINQSRNINVRHQYVYNEMNLLSDWKVYNKSGKLSQYYRYLYDENGLLILAETYTGIKNDDLSTASYHQDTYSYFRR